MKAANSNGSAGSTWHIYRYKRKNVDSLCQKKTLENIGTRTWINENRCQAFKESIDGKIGSLCKTCENILKKNNSVQE